MADKMEHLQKKKKVEDASARIRRRYEELLKRKQSKKEFKERPGVGQYSSRPK